MSSIDKLYLLKHTTDIRFVLATDKLIKLNFINGIGWVASDINEVEAFHVLPRVIKKYKSALQHTV